MSTTFSNFGSLDSKAAGEIVIAICTGFHAENIYLIDYLAYLTQKLDILSKAIAQSKQQELTAEAKELHDKLKLLFKEFRRFIKSKMVLKSLGLEASASAELHDALERHGGAIEKLPRHAMITAMDNYFNEFTGTTVEDAGADPVVLDIKRLWRDLKSKEQQRGELTILEESIPCESIAARETNIVLTAIYRHIRDYARVGKEGYEDLLNELDVKFAPIATQVKARETRHKHDLEESAELETEVESEDSGISDTSEDSGE